MDMQLYYKKNMREILMNYFKKSANYFFLMIGSFCISHAVEAPDEFSIIETINDAIRDPNNSVARLRELAKQYGGVRQMIRLYRKLDENGNSPLHFAASFLDEKNNYNANLTACSFFLRNRINPNITNSRGETSLHFVATDSCARLLIAAGADVNRPNREGSYRPLHSAAWMGRVDVVRVLIRKGANPNLQREDESNALHDASTADVARLLLAMRAEIRPNKTCGNPFHHLAFFHEDGWRVFPILMDEGCNINQPGESGKSPLHFAVIGRHLKNVEYLLAHGADVAALDDLNRDALFYAENNHQSISSEEENVLETVTSLEQIVTSLETLHNNTEDPLGGFIKVKRSELMRAKNEHAVKQREKADSIEILNLIKKAKEVNEK
jgi:ankyrin repeat protein